ALFESFLATEGTTELLKRVVGRRRPNGGSPDSFPSGHTSFSFCMADYFGRRLDDLGDGWYCKLGYLAFAPATYVGINRVEGGRHFPTDVAFGAFLGTFLTNVVYDAHYGTPRHPGVYTPRSGAQWRIEPALEPRSAQLDLVLRF